MSKAFLYCLIASLGWAVSIVLTRYVLLSGENAYNVAFWTALFALPYWFLMLKNHRQQLKTLTKKDVALLCCIAMISCVGVVIAEMFALKYSPAVNYAFLIRTVILFTFVFAYLFLGEKFTVKKVVLAVLILVGSYFLTTKGKLIAFP